MRAILLATLVVSAASCAWASPEALDGQAARKLLGKSHRQRKQRSDAPGQGACQNTAYVPDIPGFGDKVSLSLKGNILVTGAQSTDDAPSGTYVSLYGGKGCAFQGPVALEVPSGVDTSELEFGTAVKVSDDGNVILVVADKHEVDLLPDIDFEKLRLMFDLGFVYHKVPSSGPRPSYKLVARLTVVVSMAPYAGGNYTAFSLDDATGVMSDDGSTVAITYNGLLIAEDPNDPEADPEELQIPGTINVFVGPDYKPYSTIDPPDEVLESDGANFGNNIAISGDGKVIVASDDATAAMYVYQRNDKRKRFDLVQTIDDVIPVVNEDLYGQMEHIMLSYNGKYLSYVYGNYQEDDSKDPLEDAGGIRMYVRGWKGDGGKGKGYAAHNDDHAHEDDQTAPDGDYELVCDQFPIKNAEGQIVKDADGGAMADMDGVQRVVGGFGSYGAAVYDFKHSDLAHGKCLRKPAVFLSTPTAKKVDRNGFSEAVDISGDGLVVVQGWVTYKGEEDTGAVIFNSLKHPWEYEKQYE